MRKRRLLVVSPPSGEARQIVRTRMPLVNEASADASRPAVQIFVGAPDGEVDIPIVQPDGRFPAACARSKATTHPCAWPARVIASMSNSWPVA